MSPITLLNVVLFIYVVGEGFGVEQRQEARSEVTRTSVERRPTQGRRTYRRTYRTPTQRRTYTRRSPSTTTRRYASRPVTRRYSSTRRTSTRTSSKKPNLFSRIMERVQNVRQKHDSTSHSQNKWSTRKSAIKRPTTRRTRITRTRRTIERPPTRRVSTTARRTTVRRVPYKRPIERVPVQRTNNDRRITEERPPTRRVSNERRVKPVETIPKKVVTRKKSSIFQQIMSRVTNIRNDGGNTQTSNRKPTTVVRSKYTPRVSTWKPHTCLRKGCRMSNGVLSNHVGNYLNTAYRGDKKKLMKVVTWNIFEGKTPNRYLNQARGEVCARLKLMEATVFGFQDTTTHQIRAIQKCLPRYSKVQGRGRYDYGSRRWVYNPIFYKTAQGPSVTKLSEGSILTYVNRRSTPIANYIKVRFNTPKPTGQTTKKKNNINQLWKRLNNIFNNAQSGKSISTSNSGSATEVLIVNTNLITNKPDEGKRQIKEILTRLPGLSKYWKTPIILMGDFKFEDNSVVSKAIHDSRKFHNTFDKHLNKNSHPMITRFKERNAPQDFVHYILESKLGIVFAATISDRLPSDYYKPLSSKPVLAAFKMP